MLAIILWLVLGWRAGAAELLAEAAIGLLLFSGGGGRRVRAAFRDFWTRTTRRRAFASA